MAISRRQLLRTVGASAAVTALRFPSGQAATSLVEPRARAAASTPLEETGSLSRRRPIRLNRNENAYGPSANAIAAIREASLDSHRYPDGAAEQLRNRIAAHHQVDSEQIVLGCGSGELLRMTIQAFVPRGRTVLAAWPTCDLIGHYAGQAERDLIRIPLTANYAHDLDVMHDRADTAGLIYICNPNNPTGTLTPRRDFESFVARLPETATVAVDEAYHHYAGRSTEYVSLLDRPLPHPRLIVLRSFSKIHGLAGLRVGYAVAERHTAARLAACGVLSSVNIVAAQAAGAALDDSEHVGQSISRNLDDRQEFLNQANARMIRSIDSRANFVMLDAARPATDIVEHFRANEILVSGPVPGFVNHIRVSMGTAEEMCEFWRVWDMMGIHTMTM
jgi:histidinol-phosphate aminotransferase